MISDDSFLFNGIDMLDRFSIRMLAHKTVLPPKRRKKVRVMSRSGSHDFNSQEHDDKLLVLDCMVERKLTLEEFDDFKYLISQKGKITLFDEPNRDYIGEIFDTDELIEHFNHEMREFDLTFECEPYVTGNEAHILNNLGGSTIDISYKGTAKTPTLITIKNTGDIPITGVSFSVISRQQKVE